MDFPIRWFHFSLSHLSFRKDGGRSRKNVRRATLPPFSHRLNPHGSALVMAAIFMVIAITLITVGVQFIANAFNSIQASNTNVAEAEQVAEAGLAAAVQWFAVQTGNNGFISGLENSNMPITMGITPTVNPYYFTVDQAFNPAYSSNPQATYTSDSTVGLMMEYPLDNAVSTSANYWGRYEVWQQGSTAYTPGAGSSVVSGVIEATPATVTYNQNPYAVHDASGERYPGYVDGDGLVWVIYSKGYVYKRMDKTLNATAPAWNAGWNTPYNQAPNIIEATAIYKTEIRKFSVNLPVASSGVTAALYVGVPSSQVTLEADQTELSTENQSPLNCVAVMGVSVTNP